MQQNENEVVILVKAAPQLSIRNRETVCCAGITPYGKWLRLYPVSFRYLEEGQKFGRWDRIRFKCRMPDDDNRPESRRIDQDSVAIVGELKLKERESFLANSIVTSLDREREDGKSFALLRPEIIDFWSEKKTDREYREEMIRFEENRTQPDLLAKAALAPYKPCPYKFKYKYRTDDGSREGTCQDWEIEATFFRHEKNEGTAKALEFMQNVFGKKYPREGMVLAMGTHSRYPDTWLINGVIKLPPIKEPTLF